MRIFFLIALMSISITSLSQARGNAARDSLENPVIDSLIKKRLIELAMENPAFRQSGSMITAAQLEVKRDKTAWLNSVVVSGNINEFVINNTTINGQAASTLYPKYNIGVNVPLGMFSRQEKNLALEKVKMYEAQQDVQKREIRKEVLIRYENYKEKKELLELQKQITDGQNSTYLEKQKDYASGEADVKDVNKEYELWIEQRSRQRSKDKDLKVAELELEELIGVKVTDVINSVLSKR